MKFYICVFFENLSSKFKFQYNLTRLTGTVHEDQYIFSIVYRSVLLKMRYVLCKNCKGNHSIHFIFDNVFYKIMPFLKQCGKLLSSRTNTDDNMADAHFMLRT